MTGEKRVTIAVLIDALSWDALDASGLLADRSACRKRLRTILGYSSAAVPSILTGRLPQVHGRWSYLYYDPEHSPFGWTRPSRLAGPLGRHPLVDNPLLKRMISRWTARRQGFDGYFPVYDFPIQHLHLMDHCSKIWDFNPNAFAGFDPNSWRNRAITDPYEPGSTMKIFTAAAALESGRVGPDSVVFCENGKYWVGTHPIHDVKGHAWLSLSDVLQVSSNIGAAKVGELIGPEQMYATLQRFGFGEKTGIDCPGESPGMLSSWRRWSRIDQCAIAFGQGMSVTAVQLAAAAGAIANDGMLMQPYIVQAITDANGRLVHRREPTAVRRAVSPETARQIRRMMGRVVAEDGSGVLGALEGYAAGGKTGTAQKPDNRGSYAKDRYVASFLGFAPADRPEIVVLVVIDEPKASHYGGVVAAPAFKRIAEETLHYLDVPPRKGKGRFRVSAGREVAG